MTSLYVTLCMLVGDAKDRLRSEDRGATAVEYGLMVGLIAAVIVGTVALLGGTLDGLFVEVNDAIN
jgi:pilus assembly protein Flp/PilA